MRRRPIVARTLEALRGEGWTCQTVEQPPSRFRPRRDLFGIGDILGIRGEDTMLVQVAGPGERKSHIRKIEDSEHLTAVRDAGWSIELWTWSRVLRRKKNGQKGVQRVWKVRIDDLS